VALSTEPLQLRREVSEAIEADALRSRLEAHAAYRDASRGDTGQLLSQLLGRALPPHAELFHAAPDHPALQHELDHALSTSLLATLIGLELDLTERELRRLASAAFVHDGAWLALPHLLAEDGGTLSRGRKALVREHPTYSMALLHGVDPALDVEAEVALQHHEHLDGTGFPQGLQGSGAAPQLGGKRPPGTMHPFAEIVAVANHFESSLRPRGDSPARTLLETAADLLQGAGSCYNPTAVGIVLRLVQAFPPGCRVRVRSTTSGRYVGFTGLVREVGEADPPQVRALLLTHNANGQPVDPSVVDLASERRALFDPLD
jgi:hypothetical protein